MGYSHKMSEADLELIKPIIELMEKMLMGQRVIVTEPPALITRIRSVLYNWLFTSKQKSYFKVKRENMETLVIVRLTREQASASLFSPPEDSPTQASTPRLESPGIDFLDSHLSSATDFEEVRIAAEESSLSEGEQSTCIREWIRRQGPSYKLPFEREQASNTQKEGGEKDGN